jgi:hypothetical protein
MWTKDLACASAAAISGIGVAPSISTSSRQPARGGRITGGEDPRRGGIEHVAPPELAQATPVLVPHACFDAVPDDRIDPARHRVHHR